MSKEGNNRDFDIHYRVEHQIHLLLKEMEDEPERFAFKERLSLVQIVGMYLTRDIKLRADADERGATNSGSAVRKYSGAFKTNVARGRAGTARPRLAAADDDADEPA